MKTYVPQYLLLSVCLLALASACTKYEHVTIPDNESPYYDEIPTLLIENYVNKVFIDLVGREPTDVEMAAEVQTLRDADISVEARSALVTKLQTSNEFVQGDSSYRRAYYHWLYSSAKAHLIEGASEAEIQELVGPLRNAKSTMDLLFTMQGFFTPEQQEEYDRLCGIIDRVDRLLSAELEYYHDSIGINEVMRRMIDNMVYDAINMNAFNFINATFDNLFYRFPTNEEFTYAYTMVEHGDTASLFNTIGYDKDSYIRIVVESQEFYEGVIVWVYKSLLARDPSTEEVYAAYQDFYQSLDFQKLQLDIMVGNEYANFY
jgi:hypothetical protein